MGWVKDAHGLRGELHIQLLAKSADWLETTCSLLLEKDGGESHEFDLEAAKPFKEGLLVKLGDLSNRTAAEAWKRAQVSVSEDCLVSEPGERLFLRELLDFSVFDGDVSVGTVVGFATNGPQDLLRVQRANGREALVPFVDAFIVEIDQPGRRIQMELPPGLISVEEDRE